MDFPRKNNLHLLRLIFALQVLVVHVHDLKGDPIAWLGHLPGVPAFFFLSGFLIYASYMHDGRLKVYFLNRFLRLFPALLLVTFVSALVLLQIKGFAHFKQNSTDWMVWFLAQISLGQTYNPAMFRDVGIGVINGPLWTITVEIMFYIAVPVLVLFDRWSRWLLPLLLIVSYAVFAFGGVWFEVEVAMGKSLFEFFEITPLVWGWMFGVGMLVCKHYKLISRFVPYCWVAVIPLLLIAVSDTHGLLASTGNRLGLLYFLCYVCIILYLAFGVKTVPLKTDLSYGMYIWHAPVINLLVYLYGMDSLSAWVVIAFSLCFAVFSWYCVERPALQLKKTGLNTMPTSVINTNG